LSVSTQYRLARCSFSTCNAPLRRLPAFPTRRSSDLHLGGRHLAGDGEVLVGQGLVLHGVGHRQDRGGVVHHRPHHQGDAGGGHPDRKSTRLNSSHVSISYAVFCLKKKTEGVEAKGRY